MLRLFAIFLLSVAGCSFGPGNIQSRHSTDLDARKIRRIAVIPPIEAGSEQKAKFPYVSPTSTERRLSEQEIAGLLAKLVYSTTASLPSWQIVSESEMREVAQTVSPVSELTRIKKIGELVFADAVITTRMQRYRERVGEEWGVKSPASVAFVLDLIDVRRGDVIWSARFDETQKPLSENIFALGDISQRGVRWLSAEQLMHEGVKKAVAQLHQILVRTPTS